MPDKKNMEFKKYDLDLDSIIKTFSIGKIDDEDSLTEIRKKIDEKTESFLRVLNRMIQPDQVISDIHESSAFTDIEKRDMFEIYKKLMIIHNDEALLNIDSDEKKEAEFIKRLMKKWPEIKNIMTDLTIKMRDSWKKDIDLKEDTGYMG